MYHPTTITSALLLALALCACGGATPTNHQHLADDEALTEIELGKLDEQLRERVQARDAQYEIRVTFQRLPSTDDLSTLMLVRYQRAAIGRVDLATLKSIAARDDVTRITLLTGTGYADDEADPFDGGA